MTEVQDLATFVTRRDIHDLSDQALNELKIRVLDTLGVAIGALDAPPMVAIRELVVGESGSTDASLIGGGKSNANLGAFYTSALSRYLDFMDAYLAKGETNHPSDNFGAVMAAAEKVDASGAELLTALAVAYQVHTRLADEAPVRARGFDHTTQGAFAAAAGAAKAMRLTAEQTAHAIAIAGTANVALRVTRTGNLSHWKGLAYAHVSRNAVFAAQLAERGITGPEEVFEGNKGFKQSVSGPFDIDWAAEDLESVRRTIVKKHNAEIHSQSALDAALDVRAQAGFDSAAISHVRLRTFDVAYSIIGGGEEGDKRTVRTKEEADHSLPWMIAAVLLDGELTPRQYEEQRILADDVQTLMRAVQIEPDPAYSARFPHEMPAALDVTFTSGQVLHAERDGYRGFHSDPFQWADAQAKFDTLAARFAGPDLGAEIADTVANLDLKQTSELAALLRRVPTTRSDH